MKTKRWIPYILALFIAETTLQPAFPKNTSLSNDPTNENSPVGGVRRKEAQYESEEPQERLGSKTRAEGTGGENEKTKWPEQKKVIDEYLQRSIQEVERAKQELKEWKEELLKRKAALEETERRKKELVQLRIQRRAMRAKELQIRQEKQYWLNKIEEFRKESDSHFGEQEKKVVALVNGASNLKKEIAEEKQELEIRIGETEKNFELAGRDLKLSLQKLESQKVIFKAEIMAKFSELEEREREVQKRMQQASEEKERLEKDKQVRLQKLKELEDKLKLLDEKEIVLSQNKTELPPSPPAYQLESGPESSKPVEISSKPEGPSPQYFIDSGDVLGVSVWRIPELSQEIIVRPDGRISFPLIGEVQVVNMTPLQLRQELTHWLAQYVKNPQVSISVKQVRERRMVVLGEVNIPGVYRFTQNLSMVEAIALAGGFKKYAKQSQVLLIRGDLHKEPKVKVIKLNASKVLRHGMLSENVSLQSNDIVYVTKGVISNLHDFVSDFVQPAANTAIDAFVIRSAIRIAQQRRN